MVAFTVCSTTPLTLSAQKAKGYAVGSGWVYDMLTGQILPADTQRYLTENQRNLPFDVPFQLRLDGTENLRCATLKVRKLGKKDFAFVPLGAKRDCGACKGDSCVAHCLYCDSANCLAAWNYNPAAKEAKPILSVPPLEPNQHYLFCLDVSMAFPDNVRDTVVKRMRAHLAGYLADQMAGLTGQSDLDTVRNRLGRVLKSQFADLDKELQVIAARLGAQGTVGNTNDIAGALTRVFVPAGTGMVEHFTVARDYEIPSLENYPRNTRQGERDTLRAMLKDSLAKSVTLSELLQGTLSHDHTNYQGGPWVQNAKGLNTLEGRIANLKASSEHIVAAVATWQVEHNRVKARLPGLKKGSKELKSATARMALLDYLIKLTQEVLITKLQDNEQLFTDLKDDATKITAMVADAITNLDLKLHSQVAVTVNTTGTFKTRADWYIAPDLGVAIPFGAYAPSSFVTFYGIQFHPVPINREVPYSILRSNRKLLATRNRWATAWSLNFGLTANDFTTDNPEWKGAIGNKIGLLTGAGLRLTEMLRFNGGVLWSRRQDPHPLRSDYKVHANMYLALSFDIDLQGYVTQLNSARAAKLITEN
ncbi:MAG: hypothetical protein IPJ76_13390 [Flavobacteriales bacterium]|nr:MAG: hypothetical protein IPJ76_13390 [Flavobacteriales bacterium]